MAWIELGARYVLSFASGLILGAIASTIAEYIGRMTDAAGILLLAVTIVTAVFALAKMANRNTGGET